MRLISSILLSLCVVLTSGPLMAAYSCNSSKLKIAKEISGYEIAEKTMNNQMAKHVKAVSSLRQPLEGVMHFAGGVVIPAVHGGEGMVRTVGNSIRSLIVQAHTTGKCMKSRIYNNKLGTKLFGAVDCAIVAGGNVILVSARATNGVINSASFAVVKASDEFHNAAINLSNSATAWLQERGLVGKVMSIPFVVFSAVTKLSKKIIRTSVGFVTGLATDFVTMVGDVLCNVAEAFSALFNGRFKKFLKLLLVGTVGILVNWMVDFINNILRAIKAVFKAIGRALKADGNKENRQATAEMDK